jgi:hypothetical protein
MTGNTLIIIFLEGLRHVFPISRLIIIFLEELQVFPISRLIVIFLEEVRQVFPVMAKYHFFWNNYVKNFLFCC